MIKQHSQNLPEASNFYLSFSGVKQIEVRDFFTKNGWSWRKTGWEDYELSNGWSELILHGKEEFPLLSGAVVYNEGNVKVIDQLISSLNAAYVYEFYDDDQNVLLEKNSDSQHGIH